MHTRRAAIVVAGTVAGALLCAGGASAATTVGQTGNTGSGCAGTGYTMLQDSVAAAPSYEAGADGVITSWAHDAGTAAIEMRLKVYRRTASPDQYEVVGHSTPATPVPDGLRSFDTRISVRAGDLLGLSFLSGTGSFACVFTTPAAGDRARQAAGDPLVGTSLTGPFNGATSRRVNVAAQLEPDADGDGFGDETQDQCATDATVQTTCPDTDPPQTTITKGAPSRTEKAKLKLKFTSDEAGSTFECKFDRTPFKPCTSPRKLKRLDDGKHKFKVRAVDPAGNVDASPAKDRFKVL